MEEVRAAAGYDMLQWDTFQMVTRRLARELVEEYPDRTWANVPANKQEDVRNWVNAHLASKDIPAATDGVIRWRMAICVRDFVRSSKKAASSSAADVADVADAAAASASIRIYDPVRNTWTDRSL
ncbi:hypothetical protein K504DRAFT_456753 [Pleomassaria siparia CBS 279.74]|uniref:Uncharacterized protein n=1 Tax=Pleomassaria siparia CBS 279.74 TaxID=1314801 RepID=A0A6G1KNR2_9PLEO|nr:hypothetical protein K504DRAFT_456753 [Pleomassaria siparia CBS 279.74]